MRACWTFTKVSTACEQLVNLYQQGLTTRQKTRVFQNHYFSLTPSSQGLKSVERPLED
jgi:hypothetical protein